MAEKSGIDRKLAELEAFNKQVQNRLVCIEKMVNDTKIIVEDIESPSIFRLEEFEKDLENMDNRISLMHGKLLEIIPQLEESAQRLKRMVPSETKTEAKK